MNKLRAGALLNPVENPWRAISFLACDPSPLALVRRDQSDSDGSFTLRDVPPGRYTAIAIEEGWKLDWHRRESIERYLFNGVTVTVSDRPEDFVQLAQPVPAVPR